VRASFIGRLTELAGRDRRIMLLTADLGFMVVERFAEAFPDRFVNVGVAEQNMLGLATGLAEAGFLPFCYSIAPFAVLRPLEFIRNGPVAHHLPVRIVGVGGGFDYGPAGYTHHAVEDIAVLRAMPGMTVLAPADADQAAGVLTASWDLPGPVYYRLAKGGAPVPGLEGRFALGQVDRLRAGRDVLILATGGIVPEALAAADLLAASGIEATVLGVASLQPAPAEDLRAAIRAAPAVVTLEAHGVTGGLGSLVAEIMAEAGLARPFRRIGAGDATDGRSGSTTWLNAQHGLTGRQVAASVAALLAGAG
jgi:transketolase